MEDDLSEELRFHLENEIKKNIAAGMSSEESRYEALRSFGGVEQVKEECRDVRGARFVAEVWQDVRYGLRQLRRSPGFAVTAVLTLALGIGANTAIFSVVNGVLLKALPYRDPDRLVQLYEKRPRQGRVRNPVSAPDFVDWRKQNTVFEAMAALTPNAFSLGGEGGPELIRCGIVSANFFHVLGVKLQFGRDFLNEEETPGKDSVVLLNHGLWQRRFGGSLKILGQTIILSGVPYTVVGVLPDIPHVIRSQAEIWKPLVIRREMGRGGHFLHVFARLKPGVTLAEARVEMDTVAGELEQHYPNENIGHGINVFGLDEEVTGNVRPALLILLGAVGLVLLVACTNVANLSLARTVQRRREISIRNALGAGAGRLVRQLLTESILLSLLGGVVGILLACWGVNALVSANPGKLPRLSNVRVDQQVLSFALAISLLTGVLFGLAPALYSAKTRLSEALKQGGRSSVDHLGRNKARGILVVAEVAFALLLSIGAGLMMQSFLRLATVNPGFDAENVLAIDLSLMGSKYSQGPPRSAFFRDFLDRMRPLPGVLSVGATTALPLSGQDSGNNFVIEGRPALPYSQQPNARYRAVAPGYFETMRIPLRAGRLTSNQDFEKASPVLVINEAMARQYWPDEDALHKRIAFWDEKVWREIVGIVGDVKHYSLDGETRPEMYFPYQQQPQNFMTVVVRAASAPERLAGAARHEVTEIDKDQPIAAIRTVEELFSLSVAQPRFYSALLALFSAVALVLAAVGIYGVMSFAVGQRTHEIGVRMALGARASKVQGMVLREGLILAFTGVGLGIAGAFVLTRVLEKLLYGVSVTDPLTYLGASLLLIAVAAGACYFPARRATRVDPIIALRCE